MVLGLALTQPTAASASPAVAAVVASMDPHAARFAGGAALQPAAAPGGGGERHAIAPALLEQLVLAQVRAFRRLMGGARPLQVLVPRPGTRRCAMQ